MGALLVLIVTDSLTSFGVSGPVNSTVLGCVLIAAVFVDMRLLRNRDRWLSKVYVSPAYLSLPPPPSALDPSSPYALNDKLRVRRDHRPRPDRRARGRHSRPRRQSLLRHPPRRHRPLLRPGSSAPRGVRPYRRPSARHGLRPQGQSARLHRRHGALCGLARQDGDEADGRDQPKLALGGRRFSAAARRRCRRRARRARLFQRGDRSATSRRTGRPTRWRAAATAASSATIRARASTRNDHPQDRVRQRRLHVATTADRSSSRKAGPARSSATISTARRRAGSRR